MQRSTDRSCTRHQPQMRLISDALLVKIYDMRGEQVALRRFPGHIQFSANSIENALAQVEILGKKRQVCRMNMLSEHYRSSCSSPTC